MNIEKSKRLSGEMYNNKDPLLLQEHLKVQSLLYRYNRLKPQKAKKKIRLLKQILGSFGNDICIEQPFLCDFGCNIFLGNHFYSNYNLIILDCNKVTIGNNCYIGPNVSILTVNHSLNRLERSLNQEYAKPVFIGNDVWIGCGAIINPGITIGDNVVIGSGSIVTKNIPANSLVVGNPARVIRTLQ